MEDNKLHDCMLKEIDLIQEVIKRMAHNSFLIKGWTVTLVLGTFLFNGKALLAFIPLISFWYLDAYFLRQERLYRRLYNWVINNRLKTDEKLFDLSTQRFKDEEQHTIRMMFSITLFSFYGTTTGLAILYLIFF